MRRSIGKMMNGECRMTKIQGATTWAAVDLKFDSREAVTPRNGVSLARPTLFGFVICHGYATYLVRSVGLQNCDPERKSSARRSVALESCFRKCESRNRRAQECRSHPDYARSL